jgi:hypothetical protein
MIGAIGRGMAIRPPMRFSPPPLAACRLKRRSGIKRRTKAIPVAVQSAPAQRVAVISEPHDNSLRLHRGLNASAADAPRFRHLGNGGLYIVVLQVSRDKLARMKLQCPGRVADRRLTSLGRRAWSCQNRFNWPWKGPV